MALYVALCYYDRDRYWDEPPETEFSPEYTEFARRATEAGVMRGGEALHPVTMLTTITVSGGRGGDVMLTDGPYAEAKEVLAGDSCWRRPILTRRSAGRSRSRPLGGARSNSARSRHTTPRRPPMDAALPWSRCSGRKARECSPPWSGTLATAGGPGRLLRGHDCRSGAGPLRES